MNMLNAFFNKAFPEEKFRAFLWIVIIFNIFHAAYFLLHPFTGPYEWRDAQTYGVARNFLEEAGSLLEPKYDIRNSEDGRLPGEFPLQTWYVAAIMHLTSVSLLWARISTFLLGLLSGLLLYQIVKKVFSPLTALIALTIFFSNPLAMSQSISVMPETMVNLLFLISLFCYFYIENHLLKWFLVIGSVSLCTLIKPSGFVIICFFIGHSYFTQTDYRKLVLPYVGIVIAPIVLLKLWMNYTLQFEHPEYGYPITHHYVRTFQHFLHDFDQNTIFSALEKTFRHGFNIVSLTGLVILFIKFLKYRKIDPQKKGWFVAVSLWLMGSIAFLFYAGDVQRVQLYYAAPVIIPALLLTVNYFSLKFPFALLAIIAFVLQTNIKINSFSKNYNETKDKWESMWLEKETDKFSSRKDLFIVYPYQFPNFTMLGRLGRKGFNLSTTEWLENQHKKFQFLCLTDTTKRNEVLDYVEKEPVHKVADIEFYRIKN